MDDPNGFLENVIEVYRKEFKNFGFIPAPRLRQYYSLGRFYANEDGFILIGSLKSETTPIYAVYIYPQKRNGSTDKVLSLLRLIPRKRYRVRCHFGSAFWRKQGMELKRVENNNHRKRDIYVLEGEFCQLFSSLTARSI